MRAWIRVALAGKSESRRHFTTSFRENVAVAQRSYQMLEVLSFCLWEGLNVYTSFNKNNHANFSGTKSKTKLSGIFFVIPSWRSSRKKHKSDCSAERSFNFAPVQKWLLLCYLFMQAVVIVFEENKEVEERLRLLRLIFLKKPKFLKWATHWNWTWMALFQVTVTTN